MKRILIMAALGAAVFAGREAEAAVPGGCLRWLGVGYGPGYHASACCKYGACLWSEPVEIVPAPPEVVRDPRFHVASTGPQPRLAPPEAFNTHKSVLIRSR